MMILHIDPEAEEGGDRLDPARPLVTIADGGGTDRINTAYRPAVRRV